MSAVTFTETDHYSVAEIGAEWLADAERAAGADLVRRLHDFAQGTGDGLIHLLALAYDAPGRDVASFIGHLRELAADEIVLHAIAHYEYHYRRMTPPETMRAAVDGDRAAIREFLHSVRDWPEWQAFLERNLGRDVEDIKAEVIGLLTEWNERVWLPQQERIMAILERDADAKRELSRRLPFEEFVEVATNGVRFVPHPGIERVVLVPDYINRPWVSNIEHRGAMILIYPVADESVAADLDTPPLRLVRLAKALGDEKRLRILRALAENPRGLADLAEQFEMPKTTMHHHMVTLRSAGLVSVGAGTKDYRIRRDALPDLVQLLSGYIGTDTDGEGRASASASRRPPRRRRPGG